MKHFPIELNKCRGIPYGNHPGAFSFIRKYDIHTGIDLYGERNDPVFAINDGIVVKNARFTGDDTTSWWLPTDALLIKDKDGFYVYGEIESAFKEGDIVESGQKIGHIIPVLPNIKLRKDIPGHSVAMLHIERLSLDYNPDNGWVDWFHLKQKPDFLLDPTQELIDIATENGFNINLLEL